MKLTLLVSLALLVFQVEARMVPKHKRNLQLLKRQSISLGPVSQETTTPPADQSSTPPPPADASSTGGLLDGILDPQSRTNSIGPASPPNPLLPPDASSSASVPPASASLVTSSTSSNTRSVPSRPTSADVETTNITSTQSNSASQESQKQDDDDEEGGGVGKKTLIIVISVASAVGLIAAIWTILRKWKFSPSRKFEERLNPIDWDPHAEIKDEKVDRSPSVGSGTLNRQNSWGSARGAAMSEVTGYTSRPAPSPVNGFNGAAPAYLPSYPSRGYGSELAQQYPSNHSLTNPYEYPSVTRQGTQISGGRYGEGYQNEFR